MEKTEDNNGDIEGNKDEANGNITQPGKDDSKFKENNSDCRTNKAKNQNGNKQKGKCLQRLTIVNILLSLSSISLGIAVLVEGRVLSHWVVKSAFGIWYGVLVSSSFRLNMVVFDWYFLIYQTLKTVEVAEMEIYFPVKQKSSKRRFFSYIISIHHENENLSKICQAFCLVGQKVQRTS